MPECIECGDEISDEDDAVYGQGTSTGTLESAENGETISAEDAFEFDDGPYCGINCLLDSGRDVR